MVDFSYKKTVPDTSEGAAEGATKEEISRFDQAQYLVENLQVPSSYSSSDPQHFMFSSTFDGTWNDREVMKNPTVPAKLEMLINQLINFRLQNKFLIVGLEINKRTAGNKQRSTHNKSHY